MPDLSLIPEEAWREAQHRAEVIRLLAVLLVQLVLCVLDGRSGAARPR